MPTVFNLNRSRNRNRNNNEPVRESRYQFRWRSWLYQSTFGFFILLIVVLLAGSAWALSQQALRGGPTRWNVFLIIAAYVALEAQYKANLEDDAKTICPYKTHRSTKDHIMVEYSRTAVIAHISQATKGWQEGWGRPGTKWENQHFRTYILSTIPKIPIPTVSTSNPSPTSLQPWIQSEDVQADQGLLLYLVSYEALVDKARYGRREPNEEDAMAAEKCVGIITKTMELKRLREKGGSDAEVLGSPFRG